MFVDVFNTLSITNVREFQILIRRGGFVRVPTLLLRGVSIGPRRHRRRCIKPAHSGGLFLCGAGEELCV